MAKEGTFNSIEEFDKMMEEQYSQQGNEEVDQDEIITEDEIEEEQVEDEIEEEQVEEETEENEDTDEEEKETLQNELNGNEEIDITLSKEDKDKKQFAFAQLRKEKAEYEKKYKEISSFKTEFDDLAKTLGYKDSNELLQAERNRKLKEEAESKGVKYDFYKEFIEMKESLEREKQQKEEQLKQSKVDVFVGALNDVSSSYKLSEDDKASVLSEMEKDGYSLDDLVSIKNPKKFILGYVKETVIESAVQSKLLTNKKEKFKEEKFNQQSDNKKSLEDTQKELIEKEMREYARKNGLDYK